MRGIHDPMEQEPLTPDKIFNKPAGDKAFYLRGEIGAMVADIIGGEDPHDIEGEYGQRCIDPKHCVCHAEYVNQWVLMRQRKRAKKYGLDL